MPDHTLKERLRTAARARASSSVDRIAAFDASEQGNAPVTAKPEAKPKKKPVEKRGVGKPSFDLAPVIAKIKAQIARLNGQDPEKEATLLARIAALKANQGL